VDSTLLFGSLLRAQTPPRVLTQESLAQMTPLVSLLLGLSGFLVGLQAVRRTHDWRLTLTGVAVALSTLLTLTAAFAIAYGLLASPADAALFEAPVLVLGGYRFDLYATGEQCAVGLVLAAAATVTFSSAFAGETSERLAAVPAYRLLKSCAFAGQWIAVAAVAVVLAATRSGESSRALEWTAAHWFAGAVALGVVLGVCFTLFIGRETSTSRIFLATVGTVTFGAGVGAELGVSPMFVNLVTGATVAVTSPHSQNLQKELSRLRHPISVLFLVLTGALWAPPSHSVLWVFPLVYLLGRWLARISLPGLFTRALTSLDPTRIGVGLLSQGTLAVAVAVDYALQTPRHAGLVLTTAILGTLVFDVVALGALKRFLIDAETEQSATTASPGVPLSSRGNEMAEAE
jgi:hypothetical protein